MPIITVSDTRRMSKAGFGNGSIAVFSEEGAVVLSPARVNKCPTPCINIQVVDCTDLPVEDVGERMTPKQQDTFLEEVNAAADMGNSLTYTAVVRKESEAWKHAADVLAALASAARQRADELRTAGK